MSGYYGDYLEDATVYIPYDSGDGDGASITKSTDGTLKVYKDGGTTSSTDGITEDEDRNGVVGMHVVTVDTSAHAFYATGHDYHLCLEGAVVATKTVNRTLGAFSIENRNNKVDAVKISGDSAAADALELFIEALGTDDMVKISTDAQDLSGSLDVNTKTITAAAITAAVIAADAIGSSELATTAVNKIRDALIDDATRFSGADIGAILGDTNELQTDDVPTLIADLPTAAENRTEMDDNSTQLAAIVEDTAELQTDNVPGLIGDLENLSADGVNAEVDTALADINLDHLMKIAVDTDLPTTVDQDSALGHMFDAGTGGFSYSRLSDSLETVGNSTYSMWNGGVNAAAISGSTAAADAVEANIDNLDAMVSSRSTVTTAEINVECDTALADYNGPTNAEMEARTLSAGATTKLEASVGSIVIGTATSDILTTTQISTDLAEITDTHFNGRVVYWISGVLEDQARVIVDYTGSGGVLGYAATTDAPKNGDRFVIV